MAKRPRLYAISFLRLAILCLASMGGLLVATAQTEPTPLQPGAPIERDLKGGETNTFRLQLSRGQFLHVVVLQKGIDVEVVLFGPDGRQIANVDSPNGNQGPEPVVALAEASGDYRLQVLAPNKKAAAGRYEIRLVDLREATSEDRDHVAAENAFAEAYRKLAPQHTADSRRAAIEKYKQALQFFERSGDRYREALTLYIIGITSAQSGEFRQALEYYNQALPLFRATEDRLEESVLLNSIGGAYDVLGELRRAQQYYGEALSLARIARDQHSEAIILSNLGKIYNDLADWQKAVEYFDQALPLFRSAGDQRREGITLNNIGAAYSALGQPEKAVEYFQPALLLRHSTGDKAGEAQTLTNIGRAQGQMGETQTALEYFNQALPLQRAAGDRIGEGSTLNHIGVAYAALGDLEKALEFHRQALQLKRAVGDRRGEAIALNNIGHVFRLQHQTETSRDYYNQASSIFRSVGDRQYEAEALQGLARAERDGGNLIAARTQTEAALALVEEVRARVLSEQLRASYLASEQDIYHFYIELLMQLHRQDPSQKYDAEALQASERARARSLLDMLAEAHVDIRQGVNTQLIDRERDLVQLLNARAQRQIQLMGQKSSQEQLAQSNKEISALEDEYQQVQSAIRKASPAYAALTQPKPLSLKEIQEQLDPNTILLEYSLGEERSYVWAITQTALSSYELPKREQLEKAARQFYELLTTRSLFKPGEGAAQRQERIAQADAQLLEASKELSRLVLGPVATGLGNKRLVIVADGALQYVPFAALSVVSGQLSVVNGSTIKGQQRAMDNGQLTTDKRQGTTATYKPLIIDHEVISLPSASALSVQRKSLAGRKPAANAVAVIADPVFSIADERLKAHARTSAARSEQAASAAASAADSANATRIIEHLADDSDGNAASKLIIRRLRFTRQEAEQILAVAPRTSNLKALDFKASRATATAPDLSHFRYVHFATHGYLDSERPDLSAMVLSLVDEQGKPQDGFLRAHEIYNLNLPAELVVLSACQTGLGKEIKGEGLVGLTQGFMYAGARRVVVSLWSVNDKATAELMQRFYRGMLTEKQTPAASLRKAQAEMSKIKQWQSPYYWAAFQLQGEWK
jgi:CHAT domain-containing protein/tetratricopeptide (TPR) repeat protein